MGFCLFKYWKRLFCSYKHAAHRNCNHFILDLPLASVNAASINCRRPQKTWLLDAASLFWVVFCCTMVCQFFHLWLITLSWIELTPFPLSKTECFVRVTVSEVLLLVVYVPGPMWSSMMLRDSWMDFGLWWANWICELLAMEGYILVAGEVEEWRSRKSWLGIPVVAGWEVTVFAWCGVVSCCIPFANFAGYLPVLQVCLILDLIIAMSNRRWKTFFVHVKVVFWCYW